MLQPRKQDRGEGRARADGTLPVTEKFHISLYSFRAARPCGQRNVKRSNSYREVEPRSAHHEIPDEEALRCDLAHADWTLVLLSPGWTGTPAWLPKVLAAVRLSDLACGALMR